MAQTALTVTVLKQDNVAINAGDLALTFTASDNVNGNSFPITGNEILLIQNSDAAGAHTFTVTSVPDAQGRSGDIASYSLPLSTFAVIQMSLVTGWRQADGNVYLASNSNLIKFAVLRAL